MMKQEQPYHILLVEDNPDDIIFTGEALSEVSYECVLHTAKDGIEAMEFLSRAFSYDGTPVPDLILLDLNLPRKSGLEFLEEMKADGRMRIIPVVVLTTSKSDDDIRRSYFHYANSYLVKPIDINEFIELIKAVTGYWFSVSRLPGR